MQQRSTAERMSDGMGTIHQSLQAKLSLSQKDEKMVQYTRCEHDCTFLGHLCSLSFGFMGIGILVLIIWAFSYIFSFSSCTVSILIVAF